MSASPPNHDDPFLHRQLRALPDPRAPEGLAAGVLATVRERSQPHMWWQRPILQWPFAARLSGVSILWALAAGFAFLSGWTPSLMGPESGSAGNVETTPGALQLAWWTLSAVGSAFQASLSALPLQVWWVFGAIGCLTYIGCLAVGAWVYRHVLVRR